MSAIIQFVVHFAIDISDFSPVKLLFYIYIKLDLGEMLPACLIGKSFRIS